MKNLKKLKGCLYDWHYSVKDSPSNQIGVNGANENRYFEGCVATRYGIVQVYSQGRFGGRPYTRLSFAMDGFFYAKTFHKHFSRRYLVTLSVRFADAMLKAREA